MRTRTPVTPAVCLGSVFNWTLCMKHGPDCTDILKAFFGTYSITVVRTIGIFFYSVGHRKFDTSYLRLSYVTEYEKCPTCFDVSYQLTYLLRSDKTAESTQQITIETKNQYPCVKVMLTWRRSLNAIGGYIKVESSFLCNRNNRINIHAPLCGLSWRRNFSPNMFIAMLHTALSCMLIWCVYKSAIDTPLQYRH
jgi:hypothetical protein